MANILSFEGYIAHVDIDFDSGVLHGEVVNTRDVLTFSAKSVSDLEKSFAETIADYREWCAAEGVQPEKPYSGTLTLRLTPELHRLAAERAIEECTSLSAWLVRVVECEVGNRPAHVTSKALGQRVQVEVREEVLRVLTTRTVMGGTSGEEEAWSTRTVQ
jgi:predicted HicB family RNase H-like nuclease